MPISSMKRFLIKQDQVLKDGVLGLLCNQTSYDFESGRYLFEILADRKVLRKVFIPEHGLFSELQDQLPLNSTDIYSAMAEDVEFVSLYQSSEDSLKASVENLKDLDALIIDIQDTGCRYFTYLTTIYNIFETIYQNDLSISVYVLDKPNPAGRQVEGTLITKEYSSFIGIQGLPHRQGLTIGEMCLFFKNKIGASFELEIIPLPNFSTSFTIQPSPNISTETTSLMYSGQCLFEGTVLSEGRGTTRPFEIIGAPFIQWRDLLKIRSRINSFIDHYSYLNLGVKIRPLCFIPAFHKFAEENCRGFQFHLTGEKFHSLLYSMILIRMINEFYTGTNTSIWLEGKYESGSEKTALEIIVGDSILLDFVNCKESYENVISVLEAGEESWIKLADKFRIYDAPLYRLKF